MKAAPFTYASPDSVEGVLALLAEHGDEAKCLAGGQSLIPLLALRLARPTALIDLDRVEKLCYLHEGDVTSIGAMTTHRQVETNEFLFRRCRMIREAMSFVGHVAIRNRGTVGGSCAHADPAAEWPVLASVLDAEFQVRGPSGPRAVPAEDLFRSTFTTSLGPEEIVTEIRLALPPEKAGTAFMELARRHGDFGIAGVAAVVTRTGGTIDEARISLMGVAGTPIRATVGEEILQGAHPTDDTLDEVAEAVGESIEPHGDIHGSAAFRRNTTQVLLRRAVLQAFERAGENA